MPTARELLEQADALMRRNRGGAGNAARDPATGPGPTTMGITHGPTISPRTIQREPIAPSVVHTALQREPGHDDDVEVPLLTDAVTEPIEKAPAEASEVLDDVPLLTDAVEEIDVTVVDEAAQGEPSYWELTTGETSLLGPAPDSVAVVPEPPPVSEEAPRDPLGLDRPAPGFEAAALAGEPPAEEREPAHAPDPADVARVRAIAEEIGMQVLQRIDIFSDTTLRAQLGERMKPVVDRVSAELVAEINQHVGELVRAYIAEAIEREIESWRRGA